MRIVDVHNACLVDIIALLHFLGCGAGLGDIGLSRSHSECLILVHNHQPAVHILTVSGSLIHDIIAVGKSLALFGGAGHGYQKHGLVIHLHILGNSYLHGQSGFLLDGDDQIAGDIGDSVGVVGSLGDSHILAAHSGSDGVLKVLLLGHGEGVVSLFLNGALAGSITCAGTCKGDLVGFQRLDLLVAVDDDVAGHIRTGDGVGGGAVVIYLGLKAGVCLAADGHSHLVDIAIRRGQHEGVVSLVSSSRSTGGIVALGDSEGLGGLGTGDDHIAVDIGHGVDATLVRANCRCLTVADGDGDSIVIVGVCGLEGQSAACCDHGACCIGTSEVVRQSHGVAVDGDGGRTVQHDGGGGIKFDGIGIGIHIRRRDLDRRLALTGCGEIQSERVAQLGGFTVTHDSHGAAAGNHAITLDAGGFHVQRQNGGVKREGHVVGVVGVLAVVVADGHRDLHDLTGGYLLVRTHGHGVALGFTGLHCDINDVAG